MYHKRDKRYVIFNNFFFKKETLLLVSESKGTGRYSQKGFPGNIFGGLHDAAL